MVKKKPKEPISIIIVNWNTKNDTVNCLRSIYKNCTLKFEIIVIDNNSQDDSYIYLKKHFPNARLFKNKNNLGYAKANNQGVRRAKHNFIIILNPDTQVQKNTFEALVKFYKNNLNVGAIVPKLLNPDGSTQYFYHRQLPTLKNQFASLIYNYTSFKKFKIAKRYFLLDQKFEKNTEIEQAAGVCIFTSKTILKKVGGLFDEKLPIFFNDIDFSFRLKKANLPIYLVADSKIVHFRSSSTSKLDPYTLRQEIVLSTLHYFKKNHGFLTFAFTKLSILTLLIITFILTSLGVSKNYFMTPITSKKESLPKQWQNLKAAIINRRNHPGLTPTNV